MAFYIKLCREKKYQHFKNILCFVQTDEWYNLSTKCVSLPHYQVEIDEVEKFSEHVNHSSMKVKATSVRVSHCSILIGQGNRSIFLLCKNRVLKSKTFTISSKKIIYVQDSKEHDEI